VVRQAREVHAHVVQVPAAILTHGTLVVDTLAREVRANGARVSLTRREFDLLAFLLRNPDRAITRGELLERVWSSSASPPASPKNGRHSRSQAASKTGACPVSTRDGDLRRLPVHHGRRRGARFRRQAERFGDGRGPTRPRGSHTRVSARAGCGSRKPRIRASAGRRNAGGGVR
jgi:hypothetical protein